MPRSGRELCRSIGSAASGLPASKWVSSVEARWPPAEEPMMPMRLGSSFHSPARARTSPHRAGGILQHRRMPVAVRTQPVFQDEPGDAVFVQEPRVVAAFVRGQAAVAAARANHNGGAGRLGRVRQIRRERGDVFVLFAERAGRSFRPERERIGRLRLSRGEPSKECGHNKADFHRCGRIYAPGASRRWEFSLPSAGAPWRHRCAVTMPPVGPFPLTLPSPRRRGKAVGRARKRSPFRELSRLVARRFPLLGERVG